MRSSLQGADALLATLKRLADKEARKAARSAINKGLTVIARGVRNAVPGAYPDLRKTIGKRFAKAKSGPAQGQLAAKVGASVGKKQPPPPKRNRTGVGISARNVHWFILGTGPRFSGRKKYRVRGGWRVRSTGNPVRSAGVMKAIAPNVIKDGFNASASEALDVITTTLRDKIEAAAAAGGH